MMIVNTINCTARNGTKRTFSNINFLIRIKLGHTLISEKKVKKATFCIFFLSRKSAVIEMEFRTTLQIKDMQMLIFL